jgi:hypothetical protein
MTGTTTMGKWANITDLTRAGHHTMMEEGPGDRPAPPSFGQSMADRAIHCGSDSVAMIA